MTDVVLYSIYDLLLVVNSDPKKRDKLPFYKKPWEIKKKLETKASRMTKDRFKQLEKNKPTKFEKSKEG